MNWRRLWLWTGGGITWQVRVPHLPSVSQKPISDQLRPQVNPRTGSYAFANMLWFLCWGSSISQRKLFEPNRRLIILKQVYYKFHNPLGFVTPAFWPGKVKEWLALMTNVHLEKVTDVLSVYFLSIWIIWNFKHVQVTSFMTRPSSKKSIIFWWGVLSKIKAATVDVPQFWH